MDKVQILQDLKRYLLQEKAMISHLSVEKVFSQKRDTVLPLSDIGLITPKTEGPMISLKKENKLKELPKEDLSLPKKEESTHKIVSSHQQEEFFFLMRSVAPTLPLHASPSSDVKAHEKKKAWKWFLELPEIALLFPHYGKEEDLFLTQVSQAIHHHFSSSRMIDLKKIEKSSQAEMLFQAKKVKWIITTKNVLHSSPFLLKRLRQIQQTGESFLHDVPLILIEDPSLYLKNPELKRDLWKTLCRRFEKKI